MLGVSIVFILIVQTAISFRLQPEAGCNFALSDLKPEPIAVTAEEFGFIYPNPGQNEISVQANEVLIISCPGGTFSVGSTKYNEAEASCISGYNFDINGKTVDVSTLKCSRNPFHTARYTGASCELNNKEIEVGFILDEDDEESFAQQLIICFDDQEQKTLYSQYHLTKSIGAHESGVDRPSFIQDSDFFSVGSTTVNELYSRDTQRATINKQVGLPPSSVKYIEDTSDYYLSRGHFSAKADFVYAPQQTATFHYVNVAPQWQTFNGANWNTIEMSVRDYADANELDLVVYTGSYGVTTLPHEETGQDVELYLYVDGDEKGIPVPEIYWKVVYDPESKAGIAVIGINNPYQEDTDKSVICEDISSTISWLELSADLEAGYSYVCDVNDFRKVVDYFPDFDVDSTLL